MHLVYIAGPFRGATPFDVAQNVRRAEFFGLLVGKAGAVPVIPHTMFANFDKSLPDAFWLDATMDILKRCDGIVAIPGWQRSTGAKAEVAWAEANLSHKCLFGETRDAWPTPESTAALGDFVAFMKAQVTPHGR